MINAVGRVKMGGTPVGDSKRERVGFVGEVKTRPATEEELKELEETLGKPKSERACLRRKTKKERAVAMKRQGMSVSEIAEKLGISKGAVYQYTYLASKEEKKEEPAKEKEEIKVEETEAKADSIHPNYYNGKDGKDVIYIAMNWAMNPLQFNATKYIVRAGKKDAGKTIEDIDKAIENLERWKTYLQEE